MYTEFPGNAYTVNKTVTTTIPGKPTTTTTTEIVPFTTYLERQVTRVVDAIGAIPGSSDTPGGASSDYTEQLDTVVTKLDALIEKSSDTIVNVIEDDTYIPNVFYLDENNGAVDTTKDGVSLFADLVRWLWKNVFDGAFDAADITKLDGLFYDPAAVAEEVPDGS